MEKQSAYKKFIARDEISFWIPILVAIIPYAISYGILTTKIDTVIKNQESQYQMWLQLEKRVGDTEIGLAKADQFHRELKNILKLQ